MQRILKFLHTLSAIGLAGGLAAYIFALSAAPPDLSPEHYATLRISLNFVSHWLIVPSMVVALASGLLALAATRAYTNAGWAWVKAVSGVLIFESTLGAIDGPAERAEIAGRAVLQGTLDEKTLAALMHNEWAAWWTILGLCVANVVLGIWRPRFARRRPVNQSENSTS